MSQGATCAKGSVAAVFWGLAIFPKEQTSKWETILTPAGMDALNIMQVNQPKTMGIYRVFFVHCLQYLGHPS